MKLNELVNPQLDEEVYSIIDKIVVGLLGLAAAGLITIAGVGVKNEIAAKNRIEQLSKKASSSELATLQQAIKKMEAVPKSAIHLQPAGKVNVPIAGFTDEEQAQFEKAKADVERILVSLEKK